MRKNVLIIGLVSAFALGVGTSAAIFANNNVFNAVYGTDEHTSQCYWNHYAYTAPTATEPGCKEYWICCTHHTPVFEKPTKGTNINADAQAVPASVLTYLKTNTDDPRYIAPGSNTLKTAVFADVQLCNDTAGTGISENLGSTANAALALKNHLEFCKAEGVEVLFMDGDITNNAIEAYYEHYQRIFESVYGTDTSTYPEVIWNMGNHEWWDKDEHGTSGAVSLFNDYANIDSEYLVKKSAVKYSMDSSVTLPTYYKVVKGIPFLVISGESSAGNIGNTLKAEIASWLNEIEDLPSVQAGGPIYVSYHYPISSTLTHGNGSDSRYASVVEDLLKDYPQAVLFTGDTHYSGINERAINQVDFTTINIGSSSYSRMDKMSATMESGEHFYNMEISGGKTTDKMVGNARYLNEYTPTIHIMDTLPDYSTKINRYFSNETSSHATHIGKEWTLVNNMTKSKFVYTDARFETVASAQALYGKDGLNWASSAELKYGVKDGQMTVVFPDVIDYHFCEHFKITVTGTNSKVYDVVSNYYKYSANPETLYFVLEDLPAGSNYTVIVKAYDFFDNESLNSLTCSTNTTSLCIDSIDNALDLTYSDISHRVNISDVAENSGSSLEYYYKGIHLYNAGAILNRPYYPDGADAADELSIGYGTDLNVVITTKVKNLGNSALKVGLTVVNGAGQWKTDFGVEHQKDVAANSGWVTLEWNLSELFGIHSRSEMSQIAFKAKSTGQSSSGYEMHFLLDDCDIKGEGAAPRGEAFVAGSDKSIVFDPITCAGGEFKFDVLFTSDSSTHISFMVFYNVGEGAWSKYYGYFDIYPTSNGKVADGVEVTPMDDGYIRVTVTFDDIATGKKVGTVPAQVNQLYVRGSRTTADGYIEVNPDTPDPIPPRGLAFGSADLTTDLKGSDIRQVATDDFVIDVKFTSTTGYLRFMLGQGWNIYTGYYKVNADGTLGANYDGVTIELLTDGYYRVTLDLDQVTKVEDKPLPTSHINLVYISKSTATGYVDF